MQNLTGLGSNSRVGAQTPLPQRGKAPTQQQPTRIRFPELDPELLFNAARQEGFLFSDLYCEMVFQNRLTAQGRIEDVCIFTSQGATLRAFDGHQWRLISASEPTTEALIAALREGRSEEPVQPLAQRPSYFKGPLSVLEAPERTQEKFSFLSQFSRQLWTDGDTAGTPLFTYEDSRRYFLIADSNGTLGTGLDESASAVARWCVQKDGKLFTRRAERHRHDIAALLQELRTANYFRDRIRTSLSAAEKWPAPQGEIPVLWSSLAFGKLNLKLLRAFEGDLFLAGRSFLTGNTSLPAHYRIEEVSPPAGIACDHEGSNRRAMTLLSDGKPRGLACNRHVAEQLEVPSTGHSRRKSFREGSTLGFWSTRIGTTESEADLLSNMKAGISVDDIEIISFRPGSGDIELRLTEAYLVHHGEEGEMIEPITLRMNLLELLKSCHQFSTKTETFGLPLVKQGLEIITEIEAPSAMSLPIMIAGSVPPENYW